jgi:hypothetical protein
MSGKNFRTVNKIGTLTMHPLPWPMTLNPQLGRVSLGLHKPPKLGVKFLIDMAK